VHYRNLVTSTEPQNLANALAVPNWKSAMESEFSSLLCNKTWHLVPLFLVGILLIANGCIRLSTRLMVLLIAISSIGGQRF
jgi:hypothetical protein